MYLFQHTIYVAGIGNSTSYLSCLQHQLPLRLCIYRDRICMKNEWITTITHHSSYHICHQSLIPHFVCRVFSMCDILNNLNNFLQTKDSSLLICWMLFVYFLMPIFWQQIETCPLRSTKLKMPTKIPVVQKFQFGSSETQR